MPPLQSLESNSSESSHDARKEWMGFALALSLVFHIGTALIVIYAAGFSSGENKSALMIIEDIALTPTISSAPKASPPVVLTPAMTSPAPKLEPGEAATPAQETAPEQHSESQSSSDSSAALLSTPLGLGMTHGYFSGLADGRTLRDDIRGYYFEMVEKINKEWWDKAGQLKEPLRQDGIFELLIQRDGTILSIRIQQGTGLVDADRLLTEIIRNASPLPPLPATYNLGLFRAPLRIKAPSFLFRLGH